MADDQNGRPPNRPRAAETIDATFRNGSLTAVSVVVGFSLSFLTRWAGLPGPWQAVDLVALSVIILGIAFQIAALATMLSIHCLLLRNYSRSVWLFLIGLVLVATGVGLVIAASVLGYEAQLLGG